MHLRRSVTDDRVDGSMLGSSRSQCAPFVSFTDSSDLPHIAYQSITEISKLVTRQ